MSLRIREHASEDPPGEQHACRAPRQLILFNLARRICDMPTQDDRRAFMASQRLVESAEFLLDLDAMVRRVWPLRHEQIKQCWEVLGLKLNETSVVE